MTEARRRLTWAVVDCVRDDWRGGDVVERSGAGARVGREAERKNECKGDAGQAGSKGKEGRANYSRMRLQPPAWPTWYKSTVGAQALPRW